VCLSEAAGMPGPRLHAQDLFLRSCWSFTAMLLLQGSVGRSAKPRLLFSFRFILIIPTFPVFNSSGFPLLSLLYHINSMPHLHYIPNFLPPRFQLGSSSSVTMTTAAITTIAPFLHYSPSLFFCWSSAELIVSLCKREHRSLCEHFHGGNNNGYCLLGCDALWL
jgi:hypothetical protein